MTSKHSQQSSVRDTNINSLTLTHLTFSGILTILDCLSTDRRRLIETGLET